METLSLYIILFMMYSFMGWLMEEILTLIEDHKFVNRGFLIGPYCPIYGYGCLLIILLLQKYMSDPIVLFFMSILICSVLEYMTSFLMEKFFNARWWDYNNRRFNINGRICLETMIPFGILGCFILYIVNPFYIKLLSSIPTIWLEVIAGILLVIYLVDNIISFVVIKSFKNEIKKANRDQTEEITKRIKKILKERGVLYRRLLNAFPQIKTSKEVLIDIQKKLDEKIRNLKH